MGSLAKILPFSTVCMITCSLSLSGFPFLTGYYSKDAILEAVYSQQNNLSIFLFILGTLTAFLTTLYSFRLIFLVFVTLPNQTKAIFLNTHDAPYLMAIPMLILSFFSIFIGFLAKDLFIGTATDFWGFLMPLNLFNSNIIFSEFIPTNIKLIPSIAALLGAISAYPIFKILLKFNLYKYCYNLYNILNNKWYFDFIYNYFLIKPILFLGNKISYEVLDKGILEYLGPTGIIYIINNLSIRITNLQTGFYSTLYINFSYKSFY